MKSGVFTSKYYRLAIGLAISGVSLFLALRSVKPEEVWSALSQANFGYLALALLSVAVANLAKTARWKALIGQRGRGVSFLKALLALLAGQMFNLLYPARFGDLSRAYIVGGMGPGRVFVLGTVVIEKILDMLSYALLFVVLIMLIPLPAWVSDSGYTFVALTAFVSVTVFVAVWQRTWIVSAGEWIVARFPAWLQVFTVGRFHSALASLDALQSRTQLLKLAFWSAVIWAIAVLNNYLVLLALGVRLPLTASLLILIGLQAGISIPSVPGRIGIFEYICVLALGVYGVPESLAFGYGILLHAVVLLTPTLAGLLSVGLLSISGAPRGWRPASLSAEMGEQSRETLPQK